MRHVRRNRRTDWQSIEICSSRFCQNIRFALSRDSSWDCARRHSLIFFEWYFCSHAEIADTLFISVLAIKPKVTWRIGFSATILLWERVSDSKRHMVLWLRLPTPGIFNFPKAWPTSACVTPSLIRRCLNRSANASSSRGSVSYSAEAEGMCVLLPLNWMKTVRSKRNVEPGAMIQNIWNCNWLNERLVARHG